MNKIQEMFRKEAELQIEMENSHLVEVEYKPFTVRIASNTLSALDNLAKSLGKTRNEVADDLITMGLEDAVRGYASAFGDPEQTYEYIMTGSVPDIEYGIPPMPEETK